MRPDKQLNMVVSGSSLWHKMKPFFLESCFITSWKSQENGKNGMLSAPIDFKHVLIIINSVLMRSQLTCFGIRRKISLVR